MGAISEDIQVCLSSHLMRCFVRPQVTGPAAPPRDRAPGRAAGGVGGAVGLPRRGARPPSTPRRVPASRLPVRTRRPRAGCPPDPCHLARGASISWAGGQEQSRERRGGLTPPKLAVPIPTVCFGVTYVVVYTCGCDDGRIWQTRCAVIDAGRGGRYSPHPVCSTPPVAALSQIFIGDNLRYDLPP